VSFGDNDSSTITSGNHRKTLLVQGLPEVLAYGRVPYARAAVKTAMSTSPDCGLGTELHGVAISAGTENPRYKEYATEDPDLLSSGWIIRSPSDEARQEWSMLL